MSQGATSGNLRKALNDYRQRACNLSYRVRGATSVQTCADEDAPNVSYRPRILASGWIVVLDDEIQCLDHFSEVGTNERHGLD
jgi:hypothetical protein